MLDSYQEILTGTVALGYMDRSLTDFARAIKVCVEAEQAKLDSDNALIAVLCDAARVGWELCEKMKAGDLKEWEKVLNVIDVWLRAEEDLVSNCVGVSTAEAYHKGAVAYLTRVGLLIRRHLIRGAEICPKE